METQRIQSVLTAMLRDFHQFCEQHQINYSLAYGTLIGAIRHQGFIPWDDDVDVFMLPEDFIKFRELFQLENYFLQNKDTEEYYYLNFDKLRYIHSHAREKNYENMLSNQGFFIDIFPLFYVPENRLKRILFRIQLTLYKYSNLILVCRTDKYRASLVGGVSRLLYKLLGNQKIVSWNKILLKQLLHYPVSNQVIDYEMKPIQYWKTSYFQTLIFKKFGDYQFPVSKEYHEFLTVVYGDYMKIPPEQERYTHCDIDYQIDDYYFNELVEKNGWNNNG